MIKLNCGSRFREDDYLEEALTRGLTTTATGRIENRECKNNEVANLAPREIYRLRERVTEEVSTDKMAAPLVRST